MIRRPPRSTHCISSAASDVYKRQEKDRVDVKTTNNSIEEAKESRNINRYFHKTSEELGDEFKTRKEHSEKIIYFHRQILNRLADKKGTQRFPIRPKDDKTKIVSINLCNSSAISERMSKVQSCMSQAHDRSHKPAKI
eukprot:TRINITY_DN6704_c0_g1_i2.p1 TRINITY_DN6704_c0_g1~~TRINITY_DN6704_c0_g1_i2.p1  ORF type:complete len:138 (+),score=25.92 TRINITY_DN6704_c0_g1_i2:31-444(+)